MKCVASKENVIIWLYAKLSAEMWTKFERLQIVIKIRLMKCLTISCKQWNNLFDLANEVSTAGTEVLGVFGRWKSTRRSSRLTKRADSTSTQHCPSSRTL